MVFLLAFLVAASLFLYSKSNSLDKTTQNMSDEISQLREMNAHLKTEIEQLKEHKLSKAHLDSINQAFEKKTSLEEFEKTKRMVKELEAEVFKNTTADEFVERHKRVFGENYADD